MNNAVNVIVPESLQLVCDDLGWFKSTDERLDGGPARTGMPRGHIPEDYAAVNELGRRLNMRIPCAFILGEWDPDNRLSKIPHLSKYGENWNNAAYFDAEKARRCVEVINNSDYITFTLHGLLHGNYRPESNSGHYCDYYWRDETRMIHYVGDDEVRKRIDAYIDLMNYHGIKKKFNVYIPPSFAYRFGEMSHILREYGILYVSTTFSLFKYFYEYDIDIPKSVEIDNGMVVLDRNNDWVGWYKEEYDPSDLPVAKGIFGTHWPNLLHANPEKQKEVTDKWVAYFERCSEQFGVILSRGIEFAATQSFYAKCAKLTAENGKTVIDISDVPDVVRGVFYVSSKEKLTSFVGCTGELYEEKREFYNYKLTPLSNKIVLG